MRRKVLLITLIILILFVLNSCDACKTTREIKTKHISPVTRAKVTAQETTEKCEEMKAALQKYESIYQDTVKWMGSRIDYKEEEVFINKIIKKSDELIRLSRQVLRNRRIIRSVAGAQKQFNNYFQFALDMKMKYSRLKRIP